MAARLGPLADEVIEAIGLEIAEYRRPLEGSFGRGLRAGVRQALAQFLELLGHPDKPLADGEVYRELGRGELRAGRSLDALQAAYRLGARLSWRRLSAVAREQGADASAVSALAEAMFAYIEQISARSVEGYAQAQAELAGERERRRRRLVERLIDGEPLEEQALGTLAAQAGWVLPNTLAALVCETPDPSATAGLIGGGAIAGRPEGVACMLVPDPDAPGRREQLAAALRRGRLDGSLGPTVPWTAARRSFARAREGLALQQQRLLSSQGLIMASDHMLELLVHRDPDLAGELAARSLRALDGLSPVTRGRLEQTLRSWLEHRGAAAAVAAELHIHRQTVRYRLARLRELFGAALEDPAGRLEIELALRARAGLSARPA
jgi:hypothetical protein